MSDKVVIPEGAKKPQDHKKPAAQIEAEELDLVVEYNEVKYTLKREVLDDVDLFELIADMVENPILLPRVIKQILGTDQWDEFKNSNRNEAGRVTLNHLNNFFAKIDVSMGKSVASPTS